MNEFYIVRHGLTDMNLEMRLQGRTDMELNQTGINQAKKARAYLDEIDLNPDYVFSSPLKRAYKTATIVAPQKSKEIVLDDRLIEMSFGKFERKSLSEIANIYPEFKTNFFEKTTQFKPQKGAESFEGLVERVGGFVESMRAFDREHVDEDNVIFIASHGVAIRGMILYVNKMYLKDFWNIHVHNCSMFKLTFKSDNIEGSEDKCLEFFEGYTDGIDKDSAW